VNGEVKYSEKLLVGYRYYTEHKIEPAFNFGHGLSYTEFTYSNLKIEGNKVSFDLKNSGKIYGSEVA